MCVAASSPLRGDASQFLSCLIFGWSLVAATASAAEPSLGLRLPLSFVGEKT